MEQSRHAAALRCRFDLNDGQFFATNIYKNLWWELDGQFFGFGDLNAANVFRIQNHLQTGEVFQGWNEHHETSFQQTDVPMIRITSHDIVMHIDLLKEHADVYSSPADAGVGYQAAIDAENPVGFWPLDESAWKRVDRP